MGDNSRANWNGSSLSGVFASEPFSEPQSSKHTASVPLTGTPPLIGTHPGPRTAPQGRDSPSLVCKLGASCSVWEPRGSPVSPEADEASCRGCGFPVPRAQSPFCQEITGTLRCVSLQVGSPDKTRDAQLHSDFIYLFSLRFSAHYLTHTCTTMTCVPEMQNSRVMSSATPASLPPVRGFCGVS